MCVCAHYQYPSSLYVPGCREGIAVQDKDGNVVGKSQRAGLFALTQTSISRHARLQTPSLPCGRLRT
jgi:hypothetical protein